MHYTGTIWRPPYEADPVIIEEALLLIPGLVIVVVVVGILGKHGHKFACPELYVKHGFRETPEDFVSIYEQTFSQTLFFEEDISAV